MAITYTMKGENPDDIEQSRTITERKRKLATDISPRNEKNLNKRLQMDDFTGGDELDKLIKKQRKQKKNMKGEA